MGLGSDFDGISDTPEGLDNCSQTHIIAALLAKRDYSEDAIEKNNGRQLAAAVLGGLG